MADLLMRRLQWSAKLLPDPEECCKTCEWRHLSTLELISYYGNKMRPRNIDELFYFCQHDLTTGCLTAFIWPLFWCEKHYYLCYFAHLSLIEAHPPVSWVNWGKWGDSVGWTFLKESASTPLCHRGRQIRAGSSRPCQTWEFWDKSFHHKQVERPWIVPQWTLRYFVKRQSSKWRIEEVETKGWFEICSITAGTACYVLRTLIGIFIFWPYLK